MVEGGKVPNLEKRILLPENKGRVLADFELKKRLENLGNEVLSNQIQPSSFEPTLSSEIYILDTYQQGMFRPQKNKTIYDQLKDMPKNRVFKDSLSSGFELKKGYTYLIPLTEYLDVKHGDYIRSSPKSSFGRLFLDSRLVTDRNDSLDEIDFQNRKDDKLNLWLQVQPLAFNVIVYEGLSLNQLRLTQGLDALLNDEEILKEFEKNPLLYNHNEYGELIPATPEVCGGLKVHLNLKGDYTNGIIGLRARHNPYPIDLKEVGTYNPEEYFEILKATNEQLTIKRGEHYLLSTLEELHIPAHLNTVLKETHHVGFRGPLHFAGFIDNGFIGDLVLEVRPDEIVDVPLLHGGAISNLEIFRTNTPDKLYGKEIGSNYHGQFGPKVSKFFKPLDYTSL